MTVSGMRRQMARVKGFYDQLASDYDAMTDYAARLVREATAFEKLVQRWHIRRAVDVGCGTGTHSIILARLGVDVVGTDVSPQMLRRAQHHAQEENLPIRFLRAAMTDFAGKIRQPVDAIFCLGNSIAHLVTAPDLNKTLKQFCMLLNPNGLAVVHQLNPALLEEPLHLASFRAAGEILWQRFYLSVRGEHRLCWLRLQKHDAGWKHIMVDTAVRLRQPQELAQAMRRCGFRKVEFRATLAGGRFRAGQSRDLYVFAQRGRKIS